MRIENCIALDCRTKKERAADESSASPACSTARCSHRWLGVHSYERKDGVGRNAIMWCEKCGAIRGDVVRDGRRYDGDLMDLRRPEGC